MLSCSPTPLAVPMATQLSTTTNSETPFPITSSPVPSDGGGGAFVSATPLPAALIIGTVVPLLLVIIVLTIIIIVLVAILFKTKHSIGIIRGRKSKTIPTAHNMAYYGLTREQIVNEMHTGILSGTASLHIYECLSTSSRDQLQNTQQSLVYNEAYEGRNRALATDFLDANETIL